MSRLLLPVAILALTPAAATAQLPFYFSQVPGNPAQGYRAYDPRPLTPPPVIYQPLTGPGTGPVFAPTIYGQTVAGVQMSPNGYPLYTAGYYPTFGSFGYAPILPVTIVVEQPVPVLPPTPSAVPVATSSGPATVAPDTRATASLALKFPAAAKVWLDGKTVSGPAAAERTLTSPPLRPGQPYTFKVKAEWTEDGKTRTYTREVAVPAGEQTRVQVLAVAAK